MKFLAPLFLASIFLVGCNSNSGPGEYDSFAQCITQKGAIMYGTEWCPHCQNQKERFGNSFKYVSYVDCDRSAECREKGVAGYPTWIVDGQKYPGEQELYELAEITGCELGGEE